MDESQAGWTGRDAREDTMTSARRIPAPPPGRLDPDAITETFARRMKYSLAKDQFTANDFDVYQALAFAVRDRLMERWFLTQDAYYRTDAKRVYYLSLEFLMGRALLNNMMSLGAVPNYVEAMGDMGFDVEALADLEWDAGLGNGGLGRLAACFLDSAATVGLPFYGYGIRYEYGTFRQRLVDGYQVEAPDNWLRYRNPWEIPRPDLMFPVRFYGRTRHSGGTSRVEWLDTDEVWAMAYDTPVAGYGNDTVNTLRLWAARSSREFDLVSFNAGEYVRAVEDKNRTENISRVLYPPDDLYAGKELRLKQQYFFVSATLQDLLRRFRKHSERSWDELPYKVAVQLNDTHPVLAIPELVRILVDEHGLEWDRAWELTRRVFAYTNHTVLPEALERWSSEQLGRLLPRHLEIIREIDRRFCQDLLAQLPDDLDRVRRMSIIDPATSDVRMAHLGLVGSHAVNGVAVLHTEILKGSVFCDFERSFPGRIQNKTNGITPRRWLLGCNPELAELISEAIGDGWITRLDELRRLEPLADDAAFREQWRAIKWRNKSRLAARVQRSPEIPIEPEWMLDVQAKRIHEYKRQLLNALHVIALLHRIRDGSDELPRNVLIAGKAAPGYAMAKRIIKLIHAVAELVAADPASRERLRVAFLPNYSVSVAERLFPAVELSEQISTAGTEASGTGNMKAALNGALTIGTLDGANVEILAEVGAPNIFIFGHTTEQLAGLREAGYRPRDFIERDPELQRVVECLATGELARAYPGIFDPIVAELTGADRYFLCADFRSYVDCQRRLAAAYRDPQRWCRMSILNVAGMGRFSSDRTVLEYAREIWDASPVEPPPAAAY
jgi:starch phosphorylase